jgi:hypothetical protein
MALFFFFSGCEKEKWEISGWSYAARYSSQLNHLKCENAKISANEEDSGIGSTYNIVGVWKLLLDISTGDAEDRSCNSVIYAFHADSTVTIVSDLKEIPSGTFKYEYYSDPFCPLCDPPLNTPPNLIIGENEYYCQVVQSWLTTFFVKYRDVDGEEKTRARGEMEKIFHKIN